MQCDNMYRWKDCSQEFWYLFSGYIFSIQLEQSENDNPAHKHWFKVAWNNGSCKVFFACSIQTHFFVPSLWFVVKASCSEPGDMGSIPEGCWNSLLPLGHFVWHWASHWHFWDARFIAALSIFFFARTSSVASDHTGVFPRVREWGKISDKRRKLTYCIEATSNAVLCNTEMCRHFVKLQPSACTHYVKATVSNLNADLRWQVTVTPSRGSFGFLLHIIFRMLLHKCSPVSITKRGCDWVGAAAWKSQHECCSDWRQLRECKDCNRAKVVE